MAVEAVDVGNKLNKLQKEVAVAMVPVIQKVLIEKSDLHAGSRFFSVRLL